MRPSTSRLRLDRCRQSASGGIKRKDFRRLLPEPNDDGFNGETAQKFVELSGDALDCMKRRAVQPNVLPERSAAKSAVFELSVVR